MDKKFLLPIIIVIIALAGGATFILNDSDEETTTSENDVVVETPSVPVNDIADIDNAQVEDDNIIVDEIDDIQAISGEFKSSVNYRVPAGHTEDLELAIEINDGVISSVEFELEATNSESKRYQGWFEDSFDQSELIGKKIEDVDLSRVGGASLTTNAFMDALDIIANDIRK